MQNNNILELCLSPSLGGLEMFVSSCHDDFSKKTVCKVVVAPDTKFDRYLKIEDKFYLKRNKFFPLIPALKLARYIDDNEIDIVHFHWTKDIITAVLAKILAQRETKLVQSRHMGMTRFKNDFYHKWLYKNIDMIHAVTFLVKEQLQKYISSDICPKIEMIYLGVKTPKIDKQKLKNLKKQYCIRNEFIIGIVGRIEKEKGQYKVLKAVAQLKDLNIKVIVVGSFMNDSYENELQLYIEYLNIEDKVIFTSFTKDVNEHMNLFDVNVLATENETFGLVVIEAMANKVPMIATNKGGPLEIIEDGVDGLLFDGSSEDLATKIELLYRDRALKNELSINALKKVQEKFYFDKQLDKLYEMITRE